MDFFQSHQTVPKPLLSYLLPFSRTFNCTRLVHQRSWNWSTCPANKVLLQVHAFLYTLMDFFQSHQTVPKPLLSYLLPFSRTFNCTSKTTGWFTKRLMIEPAHANKVLLQVAHAFLYTLMDFFQSHQTVPSRCYLTFFHFPTFNCTSKTTGWFTKGLKLIEPATLTKCYSR
jgi:hypothetical protein